MQDSDDIVNESLIRRIEDNQQSAVIRNAGSKITMRLRHFVNAARTRSGLQKLENVDLTVKTETIEITKPVPDISAAFKKASVAVKNIAIDHNESELESGSKSDYDDLIFPDNS